MPVFPAIAAFIAGIVGYPLPVVCQPLASGTAITYTVSGQVMSASLVGNDAFVQFARANPGDVLTITVAGQTATLPPVPASTPATVENPTLFPPPLVGVPIFVALGICDDWKSADPHLRAHALLTALYESMGTKYVDTNQALEECRVVKALPSSLASLWGHKPTNPGTEPTRPLRLLPTAQWRKLHAALWRRMDAAFKRKLVGWRKADALWSKRLFDYTSFESVLAEAFDQDRRLPPEFHGATC